LGVYLATINIFKEIGHEIQEIYIQCMEIQKSFGPLLKVATFMNLPTDLKTRKRINRMRRAVGKEKREAARKSAVEKSDAGSVFAVDSVDIFVENLSFQFPGVSKPVVSNVTATFSQGKLHAFIGEAFGGKTTLLRLIGQVILPQEGMGSVFVPPHLRILHVGQESLLVNGSFLTNILMNQNLAKVGGMSRVKFICEQLGSNKELLTHLDDTDKEMQWAKKLSHTGFARLRLTRALVMNPEVTIMHRPFVNFDEAEGQRMVEMLRQSVDEKGVHLPAADKEFRRPRTVFFTSGTIGGCRAADNVYRVTAGTLEVANADCFESTDLG